VISLVVVSHSRPLAEAAVELARQMVHAEPAPRVAVAAGLAGGELGTDATAVSAAIEAVAGPDGVLILVDLGSAVLSAELALDLLDPDAGHRVRLSGAPLVEGLVAALVLAATGADLDAVAAEAERGLAAKQDHLHDHGEPAPAARAGSPGPAAETAVEVTVTNIHGLHARPAARVVALASRFDARVRVANLDTDRGPVDAGSLSALATLGARKGHRLRVSASGPEADPALRAVEELAATGFGDDQAPTEGPALSTARGTGLDLAMGPALVRLGAPDITAYAPGDPAEEERRSAAAAAAVDARLAALEQRGGAAAEILSAQRALLADPEVIQAVRADLVGGTSAVAAWRSRLDEVASRIQALPDSYQRERAADVRSVQSAVLETLTGRAADDPDGHTPAILVVDELDAATAASVDPERVAGIVVAARGRTGHGAIIAASRGIPLLTGAGVTAGEIRPGQRIAFDARHNQLWTAVDDEQTARWSAYVAERRAERQAAIDSAHQPALTRDGTRVPVLANLAGVVDAESAAAYGADGSGLVRTEVLFGDCQEPPTVAEQTERLLSLAEPLAGRPITIRTWDVGGDKSLPFLPLPREANPFLGVRGLRAFLGNSAPLSRRLLADQLTAVCEVARRTPVQVMFPMVTVRAEVEAALDLLREVAGGDLPGDLRVGIMIEVPAAALSVELLVPGLDFVSIGTNDLTAYVVAADRGSDRVADLADPLNPAVLRLIDLVGHDRGEDVMIAVCGDLASRPEAVPLLLGLGVQELSCVPPLVPEVKAAVRRTDLAGARALAAEALRAPDAAAVRTLLRRGT
jgi:phosphocarrier protein FPr